jgi:hypothetical protein
MAAYFTRPPGGGRGGEPVEYWLLLLLLSIPPVKAACRIIRSRENVYPLICKLMGKRHDSYGAFWSGAAPAMDDG